MTIDLANPDLYTTDARFEMWEEYIRSDAKVWSDPGISPSGFWSVFSHRDVSAVLSPKAPFTSEYGMMIGFDAEHADHSGGRMLVVSEGNWHSVLKRLIGPFLSRLRAPELRSVLHEEVREIVERLRSQETTDIALTVGPRLPAAIVCEVIGVPLSEREHLIQLTNHAFGGEESSFDKMTPAEAHTEILFYFHELIERRQKEPGTDLVSALLADGRLSTEDVLINCDNVLIGGNETTRHSITGAFHAFQAFPGALDTLRADPELADRAVEEVVRWTSPPRTCCGWPPRTARSAASRSARGRRWWPGWRRPTATSGSSPTRTASWWTAPPTAIWGSAPARTTAWARRWPGSN